MPTDLGGIDPSALGPEDTTPMDPRSRLRDAFAQMIMRQREQAVPAQALWQAQAMQQGLRPSGPAPGSGLDPNLNNGAAAMPQPVPPESRLELPVAPADPRSMTGPKPSQLDKTAAKYQLEQAEAGLFGGKGQFAGPYRPESTYSLPPSPGGSKSKKKKEEKRG